MPKSLCFSQRWLVEPTSAAAKSTCRSCTLGLTVVPAINCGSCRGQYNICPVAFDSVRKEIDSSLALRFVQQSSEPNILGLAANIISMLQHVPMLYCGSLRRCGAFPFAIYPRLPGLANRSRLVKLCVSSQDHLTRFTLMPGTLYTESLARHVGEEERSTHY